MQPVPRPEQLTQRSLLQVQEAGEGTKIGPISKSIALRFSRLTHTAGAESGYFHQKSIMMGPTFKKIRRLLMGW